MNLDVTGRAVGVLRVLVMLRPGRLNGPDVMRHAMTGQAELVNRCESKQPRIRGSVRRVTRTTPFGLYRGVFESERALLVRMAFNTSGITAGGQPRLLEFESAMRVVAIAATHRPLQDLVMERRGKRRLDLTVTGNTQLRVTGFEHPQTREPRLFTIRGLHEHVRARKIPGRRGGFVRRVAICATDVIAPVLTAAKIVALFLARMAGQTRFSSFL